MLERQAVSRERVKTCAERVLAAFDGKEATSEEQKRLQIGAMAATGLLAVDIGEWGDTPNSIAGMLLPPETPHAAPPAQSATIGYWGLHLYASLRAFSPVTRPLLSPAVEPSPVAVDGKRLEELVAKVDALMLAVQTIKRGGFSIPLALVNSFNLIDISALSLNSLIRMNKVDVRAANTTLEDITKRASKGRSRVNGPLADAWGAMARNAAAATKKAAQLVERYRLSTPDEDTASQKVRRMILAGKTPPRHLREKVRELIFGEMPVTIDGKYKADQLEDLRLVATCPNLQALIIVGCPVSDVSPLRVLQNLTFIDFSGTQVADATPLKKCKALHEAFFKNTPAAENDEAHALIADHSYYWASVMEDVAIWTPTQVLPHRAALPPPTKGAP